MKNIFFQQEGLSNAGTTYKAKERIEALSLGYSKLSEEALEQSETLGPSFTEKRETQLSELRAIRLFGSSCPPLI